MHISWLTMVFAVSWYPALNGQGQAPVATPTGSPAALAAPSDLLQRSLEELHTTLADLRLEKWKNGTVRSEAAANIASLQRDLQDTLPGLLAAADASPQSIARSLPVARNLDALYDVLLRVADGARVSAPGDQIDQLVQAMASVEKSRLAFSDRLQELATGQEKRVVELQGALARAQTQVAPTPVCREAPPAPTAPAAKKKVVRKKAATKPATGSAAGSATPAAKPTPQ